MKDFDRDAMMEMFIHEMYQLTEQLEKVIINCEEGYSSHEINEVFRIMHTIKGSAAMMMYDTIATVSHSMEDLFFYIRENNPKNVDYSGLTDLILEGMDFIRSELSKLEEGKKSDGDGSEIIDHNINFLMKLKGQLQDNLEFEENSSQKDSSKEDKNLNKYNARIFFENGCEMENVRAFTMLHNLQDDIVLIKNEPNDVMSADASDEIKKNGFKIEFLSNHNYEKIHELLMKTIYLDKLDLKQTKDTSNLDSIDKQKQEKDVEKIDYDDNLNENLKEIINDKSNKEENKEKHDNYYLENQEDIEINEDFIKKDLQDNQDNLVEEKIYKNKAKDKNKKISESSEKKNQSQHVISVNVSKLDLLLNLMGELVIIEAMVTQNSDLKGLELDNFYKDTRQLRKIINDVQDTVMSMRMVSLSTTFFKMNRVVRDMSKALNKEIILEIVGEETEVDKNIIEHISDPIMHIIRNSIDHGIETPEVRLKNEKNEKGLIILEAKNSGSDVLIRIKDDGAGLNKEKIMIKAKNSGFLKKSEHEYTDKEIYQFIFLPGFSTNEVVTEYSGRGVGMDVVYTNLESVGGSVFVDSIPKFGSVFTLKIPLTLAIIEGMIIKMADAKYTIPIISIKQSFKPNTKNVFSDPNGNEMIMTRGECYNIIRLSNFFGIESTNKNLEDGIVIMIESSEQMVCLLVDELVGEQQVVVKSMPKYINKIKGISGCTLLGNGDISLIIDISIFFDK